MFVKYVTTAASTFAQVCNDLAQLASGAGISVLSASCDKINSAVIASTTAPGWSLVDASGPSSSSVISCRDAGDTYTKYCAFEPASTYIAIRSYDGYNPATHTGTNGCVTSAVGSCSPTFTAGTIKTFYLYVTPRTIMLMDSVTTNRWAGCLEFTKDAGYFQNGILYPCHGSFDSSSMNSSYGIIPRMKTLNANGDSLAGSTMKGTIGFISNSFGTVQFTTPIRDAVETQYHPVLNTFYLAFPLSSSTNGTPIGKLYDLYVTTIGAGNSFDTFTDGTDTYMVLVNGTYQTTCIKIG